MPVIPENNERRRAIRPLDLPYLSLSVGVADGVPPNTYSVTDGSVHRDLLGCSDVQHT
jgi:hypothetical protein